MESIAKLLDPAGILVRWPKHPDERAEVLKYLATKFDADKRHSEMEINATIKKWHKFNDHPMLRRELVNAALLARSPDGREYWVVKQP